MESDSNNRVFKKKRLNRYLIQTGTFMMRFNEMGLGIENKPAPIFDNYIQVLAYNKTDVRFMLSFANIEYTEIHLLPKGASHYNFKGINIDSFVFIDIELHMMN